ncbi:hypothetical protein [uncultured Tateyamaria sp.]|uniref:hypothetical protein n=1 Tax=uncultured Tateyamaria sp. TaxID=455651 RepID=UPI00261D96DC|nr:hypothetical protein [uncultured Tateyamaria sp.]
MNVVVLLFVFLAIPLGMWLRQGSRSALLGGVVVFLLLLSAINLAFGSAAGPLFYAAPCAMMVLVGWSFGKPRNKATEEGQK